MEFVVDARALRVVDSGVSDKDRADIQNTMLGPKVLDSAQSHEIRFHPQRSVGAVRTDGQCMAISRFTARPIR